MKEPPKTAIAAGIRMVGRRQEGKALLAAIKSRQSRLILGPPGIGKTRLIEECLATSGASAIRVEQPPVLHYLLMSLAVELGCVSGRYSNLIHATSVHLKALVLDVLRAKPHCVILENLDHGDPRIYRFLQDVYYVPNACLIVTSRSANRIGYVSRLLWDPRERIELKPLTGAESRRLFDLAARIFGLDSYEPDEFRDKVIEAAHGNPGQIIAMCRMATRPEYRAGRYIKFLPLRIDVLSAFVS